MDETELAFAGIARQAELIREAAVFSRELVDLLLARIERIDPRLNTFRVFSPSGLVRRPTRPTAAWRRGRAPRSSASRSPSRTRSTWPAS